MQAVGEAEGHPLTGIGAVEWSPLWRNEMQSAIEELTARLPALERAASVFLPLVFGSDAVGDHQALRMSITLALHLTRPGARPALASGAGEP